MKLKKLFAFVVAGMMAMSLAACTDGNGPEPSKAEQSQSESSKSESGSQNTDAKGGKIGISMPTKSLERWNRDGSYLEKEFEKAEIFSLSSSFVRCIRILVSDIEVKRLRNSIKI